MGIYSIPFKVPPGLKHILAGLFGQFAIGGVRLAQALCGSILLPH